MPQLYDNFEAIETMAKTLIPSYHPELATARIRYLRCEKSGKKGGRLVHGKVRKVSGAMEFLTETDFVIEVGLDVWNELSPDQRLAVVDHLLERCWGEEDEKDASASMKWAVREPDVQEFATILQRRGAWNTDLQGFCQVAQEINLADMVQETPVQTTTTTN